MKNLVTLILVTIALGGCGQDDPLRHDEALSNTDEHALHWGYEGAAGPEHWSNLDSSFGTCSSGKEQSPIDIAGSEPMVDSGLRRQIGDTVLSGGQRANVLDIVDNGHTIQITNDLPVTMWVDDIQYELVQYHFHAPSEHTIEGQHAPLEAHFVHKSTDGKLAVLGVLVEEGEHDSRWDPIFAQLPSGPDDPRHLEGVEVDLNRLRDLPSRYYRYSGSLTTPPCSEGVSWIVVTDIHRMSADQLQTISSHMPKNNRPVQPLGERSIGLVSHDN